MLQLELYLLQAFFMAMMHSAISPLLSLLTELKRAWMFEMSSIDMWLQSIHTHMGNH